MKKGEEDLNLSLSVILRAITALATHCQRSIKLENETVSSERCQFQNNQESGHLELEHLLNASQEIHLEFLGY